MAIEAAQVHPRIRVIGMDFVREIVALGRTKIERRHRPNRIRLVMSDALHLPFNDSSFDVAVIAFGIRNIPNKVCVLREMNRGSHPRRPSDGLGDDGSPEPDLEGILPNLAESHDAHPRKAILPKSCCLPLHRGFDQALPWSKGFHQGHGSGRYQIGQEFPPILGITHLYLEIKST
jgi:hypothetical protein